MVELLAQFHLVDLVGEADAQVAIDQREGRLHVRVQPLDHLQHQQLVEVGIEQAADDRIELPGVVVDPSARYRFAPSFKIQGPDPRANAIAGPAIKQAFRDLSISEFAEAGPQRILAALLILRRANVGSLSRRATTSSRSTSPRRKACRNLS